MGAFDDYRNRMSAQGASMSAEYNNDTIAYIKATFADSPFYQNIAVNGTTYGVRMMRDDKSPHIKHASFLPSTLINKGDIVQYDNLNWIVTNFEPHPLYPVAELTQCSTNLIWKDSSGTQHTVPSFFQSLKRKLDLRENDYIGFDDFQVFAHASFQNGDGHLIVPSMRFIVHGYPWYVIGIDSVSNVYQGKGYYQFGVQIDKQLSSDDMVNGIADNSHLWTKQNANPNGTNTGGTSLW